MRSVPGRSNDEPEAADAGSVWWACWRCVCWRGGGERLSAGGSRGASADGRHSGEVCCAPKEEGRGGAVAADAVLASTAGASTAAAAAAAAPAAASARAPRLEPACRDEPPHVRAAEGGTCCEVAAACMRRERWLPSMLLRLPSPLPNRDSSRRQWAATASAPINRAWPPLLSKISSAEASSPPPSLLSSLLSPPTPRDTDRSRDGAEPLRRRAGRSSGSGVTGT